MSLTAKQFIIAALGLLFLASLVYVQKTEIDRRREPTIANITPNLDATSSADLIREGRVAANDLAWLEGHFCLALLWDTRGNILDWYSSHFCSIWRKKAENTADKSDGYIGIRRQFKIPWYRYQRV